MSASCLAARLVNSILIGRAEEHQKQRLVPRMNKRVAVLSAKLFFSHSGGCRGRARTQHCAGKGLDIRHHGTSERALLEAWDAGNLSQPFS